MIYILYTYEKETIGVLATPWKGVDIGCRPHQRDKRKGPSEMSGSLPDGQRGSSLWDCKLS